MLPYLFYYLYFILSFSQRTRKDVCQSNPVWEKGRYPKRPSSSRYDINRRHRKDFQGHRLQSQAVSKNLRAPVITRNKGTNKSLSELCQISGRKTRSQKKAEPPKEIERSNPSISYEQHIHQRKNQEWIHQGCPYRTRLRSQCKKISKFLDYTL